MTGYTYTHPGLALEDIGRLGLRLCGQPGFVYSQAADELRLATFEGTVPPTAEGRVFGPHAEVRWARQEGQPDGYAVRVLTEMQGTAEDWTGWAGSRFDVGPRQGIYLLGVWQPREEAWIEVRIPHPLDYPLLPPQQMARPRAGAVEYSKDGIVQYIRLLGLSAEPIEEARP